MTRTIEKTRYGTLPSTISLKIREPGSALTHFAALVLLTAGSGPLMMHARESGSALTMMGAAIFLMTACLLYAASTCYHTVVLDERRTTIFRKLDHISIAVMIAGSYTPICLTVLRDVPLTVMPGTSAGIVTVGYTLLAAIWILAGLSVLLKLFWITCPKWLSSAIYLLMGWLCIFSLKPLLLLLPVPAFGLLLAGGVAYSIGAVIYALHPKAFDEKHIYFGSHEIFHVFIMLGTFCHYELMLHFIV